MTGASYPSLRNALSTESPSIDGNIRSRMIASKVPLAGGRKAGQAIGRPFDGIAARLETRAQESSHFGIIFDHQNRAALAVDLMSRCTRLANGFKRLHLPV